MVERLCGAEIILQQHLVCVRSSAGVERGLHFQELWEERKVGPDKTQLCPKRIFNPTETGRSAPSLSRFGEFCSPATLRNRVFDLSL